MVLRAVGSCSFRGGAAQRASHPRPLSLCAYFRNILKPKKSQDAKSRDQSFDHARSATIAGAERVASAAGTAWLTRIKPPMSHATKARLPGSDDPRIARDWVLSKTNDDGCRCTSLRTETQGRTQADLRRIAADDVEPELVKSSVNSRILVTAWQRATI